MICSKAIFYGFITILLSVISVPVLSQSSFQIENDKGEFRQKFELVNDLVIVPVEVNGQELFFLLDTGVSSTILFSFGKEETPVVNDPHVVNIKGMGVGKPLQALRSKGNTLKLGEAISRDLSIFLIGGEVFDISNRLGFPLNGILGFDFFKDFVVEFNYKRRYINVYEKGIYEYSDCGRCVDVPLNFFRNKPYVPVAVSLEHGQPIMVDLLLDSGSGDALWLFTDQKKNIHLPENSFEDFLGFGINGSVYGHRSRIKSLDLGKFYLNNVTVSFPDSLALASVDNFEERDGSLGAQVLKRFHSVVDYPGRNLRLKPNSEFRKPFEYNMSGVVVKHHGYRVVKTQGNAPVFKIDEGENSPGTQVYSTTRQVYYSLEPSYEIAEIRPGSPAEAAGIMIGDEILKLNGRPAYKYTLNKIFQLFSSKEGKRIRVEVQRGVRSLEFTFRLQRIL